MAVLGQRVKTVYVDKPNNLKTPDPEKAQAFEINIDPSKKQPLQKKLASIFNKD